MPAQEKTGAWAQFLMFMGMSYPGKRARAQAEPPPACPNCGNPTRLNDVGRFACPHHPQAAVAQPVGGSST